jgi:hypothetical protein
VPSLGERLPQSAQHLSLLLVAQAPLAPRDVALVDLMLEAACNAQQLAQGLGP